MHVHNMGLSIPVFSTQNTPIHIMVRLTVHFGKGTIIKTYGTLHKKFTIRDHGTSMITSYYENTTA